MIDSSNLQTSSHDQVFVILTDMSSYADALREAPKNSNFEWVFWNEIHPCKKKSAGISIGWLDKLYSSSWYFYIFLIHQFLIHPIRATYLLVDFWYNPIHATEKYIVHSAIKSGSPGVCSTRRGARTTRIPWIHVPHEIHAATQIRMSWTCPNTAIRKNKQRQNGNERGIFEDVWIEHLHFSKWVLWVSHISAVCLGWFVFWFFSWFWMARNCRYTVKALISPCSPHCFLSTHLFPCWCVKLCQF